MFDWIGPFLEYTSLGDRNKTSVDGKDEVWYNSKTDITFGDSNTWLIGLGRITNICGPDIKVVADWTFIEEIIEEKLSEKFNHKLSGAVGQTIGALIFGVGGASDVLFGVKNLINYGNTQDTTVIRKHTAPLEIKIFKDKSTDDTLYPPSLGALILLPYLILLTMVVTIRFANMQVGVFAEKSTREKVAKALSVAAPLVESRWIALLLVYEKLTYTADELKKVKDKIKAKIAELRKAIAAGEKKIKATGVNSILPEATKNDLEDSILVCERDIFFIKDHEEADLKSATDVLATLLKNGDISQEYKTSNTGLASSYKWLSYDAEETIYLSVGKPPKYSSMQLNPESIKMKLVSGNGINTATLNLSETDNDGGKVDIKCSGDDGYINLEMAGNDLAKLKISKNTVSIQGGSDNTKNPLIKLEDDKITLRCGNVVTNPEILITDTEVKIKVGADQIGSSFVMTNDSIELKVGELSALKITSAGIEIKSGEATSTKWSPKSIDMAAAETKMKLDLTETQQNTIRLKQNAAFKAEIKAALLMLKGDPALKLDAILKSL
jgi:hypothetical protein